jgi:hypothetical protein
MSSFVHKDHSNKQVLTRLLSPADDCKPFEEFVSADDIEHQSYGYTFGEVDNLTQDIPEIGFVSEIFVVFLNICTYQLTKHDDESDKGRKVTQSFVQIALRRSFTESFGLPSIVYDEHWRNNVRRIAETANFSSINRIGFVESDGLTFVVYQVEQTKGLYSKEESSFSGFQMVTPYEIAYESVLSFGIDKEVCHFIQSNPGFFRLYCDGNLMPGVSVGYIGGSSEFLHQALQTVAQNKPLSNLDAYSLEVTDVGLAIVKSLYEINDMSEGCNKRLLDVKNAVGSVLRVIMSANAWTGFDSIDISVTTKQKTLRKKSFNVCHVSPNDVFCVSEYSLTVMELDELDISNILDKRPCSFFLI